MPVKLRADMVIDGFRLLGPLHEGGMATLWRVSHPDHAIPMLMKLPRIGYGEAATQIVGFEVERMVMPQLSGPHVPRYIASGEIEDQPYLVMEHVSGETLRPLLDQAPLPAERVAMLGALAATALHDVHRQGVVHLDVKPSNLLLRENGERRIVLIDFGLSHHERLPDLLAEQFHIPIGTAPYIAPEQVLGVRNDPRSDLFALGVTLYHLATGQRPFGNPSGPGGLKRRLYRDPVPPRALQPQIPRWFQEVVLRCLEVDPDRRHPTAAQLAFELLHPEQVPLTERGERLQRDGVIPVARRWLRRLGYERATGVTASERLTRAPLIVAAIDLEHGQPALADELRHTVQRIVQTSPGARLACITVLRIARIGLDNNLDPAGRNRHVKRLLALRDWARILQLPDHAITFHVLESSDPAEALISYARDNAVDHIVMGARGITGVRRLLGSVSARVVAEAGCTVTVVRSPRPPAESGEASSAARDGA
jgi:nucleotide-binding universal stress UspA family protein